MDDVKATAVRGQLDRILASRMFAKSERMRQFLTFIVSETLDGRGETMKESVIAHRVYQRPIESLSGGDPIVRVDARRLRDKLREYYADNPGDPIIIRLPRGGYAPVFVCDAEPDPADVGDSHTGARLAMIIVALGVILGVGSWLLWTRTEAPLTDAGGRSPQSAELRARPLTTYVGHEIDPAWSPDGSQIAFGGTGSDYIDWDIYVKVVGEEQAVRLTSTEADETRPSWSPDGRWIAFVRATGEAPGLYLVSPLGGVERKVLDAVIDVSWAADSDTLIFSAAGESSANRSIYRFTIATGDLRQLSFPEQSAVDFGAAAAPDGQLLAFIRCATPAGQNCDVFLANPDAAQPARRLTSFDLPMNGLAWMPDGTELVISVFNELYRVSITRGAEPRRLGFDGASPSLVASAHGLRLAFHQRHGDTGIWRTQILFDGSPEPAAIGESERFIDSSRGDLGPVVSPDGQSIVFASNRSGSWLAWVADDNGGNIRLLSEAINGQFSWSPTGEHVAGLCVDEADDRNDICVVDAETGRSIKFAPSPSVDGMPQWSVEGDTIYFASDRSGKAEIWKQALATESEPVELTSSGALAAGVAFEYADILFYPVGSLSPRKWPQELWRLSISNGSMERLLDRVYPFAQADRPSGLYWLDFVDGRASPPSVRHLSRRTGAVRELGRLTQRVSGTFPNLDISPNEAYLYTVHEPHADTDILVIDGFR